MSSSDRFNDNEPAPRVVSIAEAAHYLGVSKRTIYRHLRSGKLRRAKDNRDISDIIVTDESVRESKEELSSDLLSAAIVSGMSIIDKSSVTELTGETWERLQSELRNKDTQIVKLIESQQELTQTLQRVQEQMFELARLVLAQNAAAAAQNAATAQTTATRQPPTAAATETEGRETKRRGLLAGWLRLGGNKQTS